MRINADSFVSVDICILGLVGVGYAIGVHSKMKVMCDRLDTRLIFPQRSLTRRFRRP